MGQAQKNRQQSVRYQDVELELWELDADEEQESYGNRNRRSGIGSSRTQTGRSAGNRTVRRGGGNSAGSRSQAENGRTVRNSRNYVVDVRRTGSGRQSQAYVRRQGGGQTRQGSPQRELQIQDIRRYQDSRSGDRMNARNAYMGTARPVQSIKRRRARKRKAYIIRTVSVLLAVTCLILIYFMTGEIYRFTHDRSSKGVVQIMSEKMVDMRKEEIAPPEIIEDFLEVNDFSRPGTELKKVKNIFVHYTANPGTSAAQNRSYFANLALTQERSASAHLIIGYDGELIQCIPFDEQAYAVMTRNEDSISIECCYLSEDGSFTWETYDTLVRTLAWLIDKYDLSTEDILRHYDCGGKMCPLYYVEHEDAWNQLLEDVKIYKLNAEQANAGNAG